MAELVQGRLNTKTRTVKLGYAQRAAAHAASLRDIEEAVMAGEAAPFGAGQRSSSSDPNEASMLRLHPSRLFEINSATVISSALARQSVSANERGRLPDSYSERADCETPTCSANWL